MFEYCTKVLAESDYILVANVGRFDACDISESITKSMAAGALSFGPYSWRVLQ